MKKEKTFDRKVFGIYKEYFLSEAEEERKKLLTMHKRNNLVVSCLFFLLTLVYAGAMIGVLAYDAKKAGVTFSIAHMGPKAYILLIVSIVLVGFSLVRLIAFLVKTATEQGLVDSFVEAKVKKMPANKSFAMLEIANEYEDAVISAEEYHSKIEELFKPINIVRNK